MAVSRSGRGGRDAKRFASVDGILWFEDFDAYSNGSAFDSSDWRHNPTNDDYASECPSRSTNAYHDGASNLVLRVKREPAGVLNDESPQVTKFFSGVQLCTFGYGLGWPTPIGESRHVFTPPFRYECRYKMSSLESAYIIAGWLETSNKPTSAYIHELDCGENAPTLETFSRNYQHRWLGGSDTRNQTIGSKTDLSDWRSNYHTVRCDVLFAGPEYYVDDVRVGAAGGPIDLIGGGSDTTGTFGLIIHHLLTPSPPRSSFFGGGGTAPTPDPGGANEEWLMLIDWIRVSQL